MRTRDASLAKDDLIFTDLVDSIFECPLPGCAPKRKLTTASPTRIAADDRAVYWSEKAKGAVFGIARP